MWIANGIAGVCSSGAAIFDTIEVNLAGVPIIGGSLAAPFGYFSDRLREAKGFFYDLGDWGDDVISDISALFNDIGDLVGGVFDLENWQNVAQSGINVLEEGAANFSSDVINVLGSTWGVLTDVASVFTREFLGFFVDMWANLVWLYSNFRELVADVLEGAVVSFTYAGRFIQGTVVGFVAEIYINAKDLFENFVDYVHASVVNWSETQYEEVLAISLATMGKYFDTFEETLTELLGKGFKLIERQWSILEDYFLWLAFKVLGVIADQAETFSAKLWDIFERIIEKI
jgi:hypothetical protein